MFSDLALVEEIWNLIRLTDRNEVMEKKRNMLCYLNIVKIKVHHFLFV